MGSADYMLSSLHEERGETLKLKTSAFGQGWEQWKVKEERFSGLFSFFNCLLCQGVVVCCGLLLDLKALCSIWVWLEQLIVKVNEVAQL